MKRRGETVMKKNNLGKIINWCRCSTITGFICISALAFPAWAEIECVPASAQAQLSILSPVGPAVGTAYFDIDGNPSVASVTVSFLGPPEVNPDGTQSTLTMLNYDFGGGDTITGIALGTLTPSAIPGVFDNAQKVTYVDGTGRYVNVVARFLAQGTISFLDNTATQQGIGDLCWSEIGEDDSDSDSGPE